MPPLNVDVVLEFLMAYAVGVSENVLGIGPVAFFIYCYILDPLCSAATVLQTNLVAAHQAVIRHIPEDALLDAQRRLIYIGDCVYTIIEHVLAITVQDVSLEGLDVRDTIKGIAKVAIDTLTAVMDSGQHTLRVILQAGRLIRNHFLEMVPILLTISALVLDWASGVTVASMGSLALDTSSSVVCRLPYTSRLSLCDPVQDVSTRSWMAVAHLLRSQTPGLEDLMSEASVTHSLVLDLTEARVAAGDLLPLVSSSTLLRSTQLHDLLVDFSDDAKDTSRYLQQLSAKILSGVDRIVAARSFLEHVLETTVATESSKLVTSTCSGFFSILPSTMSSCSTPSYSSDVAIAYEYTLEAVESVLRHLLQSVQAVMFKLEVLDSRLSSISEIAVLEGLAVHNEKEEVLGHLWTYLGGNRSKLSLFEYNLKVLDSVDQYRKASLAYVEMVFHTLEGMQTSVEQTRRVATGALLVEPVSMETVLDMIARGAQSLKMSNSRRIAVASRDTA